MQNRMQIDFTDEQIKALKQMAGDQMRSTKMHAQYLVIQALKEAGYLPEQKDKTPMRSRMHQPEE